MGDIIGERKKKKKAGRPKLDKAERKIYRINLKLNTADFYDLEAKVENSGCKSISEYIRECIRKSYVKTRISLEEMAEIRKLTGIANNLNQLTRLAHEKGVLFLKSNFLRLIEKLDNIINKIKNDS